MAVWERDGLRIVELGSGISAAFATRLLADFGADVIKVESPDGDQSRRAGPFANDEPHPEKSGLFLYLNFNKRAVTLEIESTDGARQLGELLRDADVLIENLGAGRLAALPLPAGALHERLIVCSISPYGQDGPKAGYLGSDVSAHASGGMMYITGQRERQPLKLALNQAAHLAGVNAAAASLAAARRQRAEDIGERIDISEQETIATVLFPAFTIYTHTGGVQGRGHEDVPHFINSMPMQASDGSILPSYAGISNWWEAFTSFIELPELLEERFLTQAGRRQNAETLDELIAPKFKERTKLDLFHTGQEWGMTFTALQTAEDVVSSTQMVERDFFVEQDHPVAGRVKMPGMAPLASAIDRKVRRPAPLLGQHNDEILGALGAPNKPRAAAPPTQARSGARRAATPAGARSLPLAGVRIIELGQAIVLPAALTPIAGMGADIVKVESGPRPEATRGGPQPENELRPRAYNYSGHYQTMNRNKRGITLDLAKARGRETFLKLVAVSDVVAENNTARVLTNLGLEYETLREVNPRIILLSSNGFGNSGPWQNYKAYGPNIESVTGLMALTGYLDGIPQRGGSGGLGVTYPDIAGAYYGAFSLLAALEHRDRTGEGQWLQLAHYESGVAAIPEAILEYTMKGTLLGTTANRHPQRAPQGVYPSAGLDRWIAISIATDAQFAALGAQLGLPALAADPRFATTAARRKHHDELDALIADATAPHDMWELERALQAVGVEAAAVLTPRDVIYDEQLKHRGFFEMVPPPAAEPSIGYRPYYRPGWRMAHTPATTRFRAPEFGEHTDEVLAEYLGMKPSEIAELEAEGVIAREPKDVLSREPVDLVQGVATGRLREVDPDYRANMERHFMGESDEADRS